MKESILSTQTKHPMRATLRTVVAVVVALASLIPVVVVTAGVGTIPAVAQVVAVAAAVTRVMALPAVDLFLKTYLPGLASAPPVDGHGFTDDMDFVDDLSNGGPDDFAYTDSANRGEVVVSAPPTDRQDYSSEPPF